MVEWISLDEYRRLPAAPGVYVIRHIESGREYVGQSLNVSKRIQSHRAADRKHYLGRALRAHGVEAFEVCFWEAGAPAALGDLEIALIAARGTMAPAGYNLAAGGLGPTGVKWSDERKAAQSERCLGVSRPPAAREKMRIAATERNPFKGKKHSAEAKAKIGEANVRIHTGMKRSAEARANISASLMGRVGSVMGPEARARMAEARCGVPNPASSQPGEKNGMYGVRGAAHPRARAVAVWEPEGMVPRIYESAAEAAEGAGVSRPRISDYLIGRRADPKGRVFALV